EGVTSQGADVIDAGLGSTDLLYFASGSLDLPGAMFTASHNPARYNGIKMCRAGASPIGQDTGLREIRALAEQGLAPTGTPGAAVSPSAVTALVAARILAVHPGATIIHNLITSHAVPEIVREHGGVPVRTRVGHSFIKQQMAETDAAFGGEHSAHYYFRDFWKADTGMLAALHVLAALGEQDKPAGEMFAEYERYVASGELNNTVADQAATVAAIED